MGVMFWDCLPSSDEVVHHHTHVLMLNIGK